MMTIEQIKRKRRLDNNTKTHLHISTTKEKQSKAKSLSESVCAHTLTPDDDGVVECQRNRTHIGREDNLVTKNQPIFSVQCSNR